MRTILVATLMLVVGCDGTPVRVDLPIGEAVRIAGDASVGASGIAMDDDAIVMLPFALDEGEVIVAIGSTSNDSGLPGTNDIVSMRLLRSHRFNAARASAPEQLGATVSTDGDLIGDQTITIDDLNEPFAPSYSYAVEFTLAKASGGATVSAAFVDIAP